MYERMHKVWLVFSCKPTNSLCLKPIGARHNSEKPFSFLRPSSSSLPCLNSSAILYARRCGQTALLNASAGAHIQTRWGSVAQIYAQMCYSYAIYAPSSVHRNHPQSSTTVMNQMTRNRLPAASPSCAYVVRCMHGG